MVDIPNQIPPDQERDARIKDITAWLDTRQTQTREYHLRRYERDVEDKQLELEALKQWLDPQDYYILDSKHLSERKSAVKSNSPAGLIMIHGWRPSDIMIAKRSIIETPEGEMYSEIGDRKTAFLCRRKGSGKPIWHEFFGSGDEVLRELDLLEETDYKGWTVDDAIPKIPEIIEKWLKEEKWKASRDGLTTEQSQRYNDALYEVNPNR